MDLRGKRTSLKNTGDLLKMINGVKNFVPPRYARQYPYYGVDHSLSSRTLSNPPERLHRYFSASFPDGGQVGCRSV